MCCMCSNNGQSNFYAKIGCHQGRRGHFIQGRKTDHVARMQISRKPRAILNICTTSRTKLATSRTWPDRVPCWPDQLRLCYSVSVNKFGIIFLLFRNSPGETSFARIEHCDCCITGEQVIHTEYKTILHPEQGDISRFLGNLHPAYSMAYFQSI